MKKIIVIAILASIFAIGDVSAQVISYSQTTITKEKKPVKFQQFAGAKVRVFANQPRVDLTTGAFYEAGAMCNKSIFVGAGLDVSYVFDHYASEYIREQDGNYYYDEYGITANAYINAKFYLTKTKYRPYFDLSVGGAFCNGLESIYEEVSKQWVKNYNRNEFNVFANPQFGLSYNIGRSVNDIFVNVGYFLPFNVTNVKLPLDTNGSFTFKLGISF